MRALIRFTVFVMVLAGNKGWSASGCEAPVAQAVSVQGNAELRRAMTHVWVSMVNKDTICAGDLVNIGDNSGVSVLLANGSTLRLENGTVTFAGLTSQGVQQINLLRGIAHFLSRIQQTFEVVTPFVNATSSLN